MTPNLEALSIALEQQRELIFSLYPKDRVLMDGPLFELAVLNSCARDALEHGIRRSFLDRSHT